MIWLHQINLDLPNYLANWNKVYSLKPLEIIDGGTLYYTIKNEKNCIAEFKMAILNYLQIAQERICDGSLDYFFFAYPNSEFPIHTDNVYQDFEHRRLIYVLQECEQGGEYFNATQKVLLKQNMLYEIEADKPHGVTKIQGQKPLILAIMSYLKEKDITDVRPT
jgi:hypothetical protein